MNTKLTLTLEKEVIEQAKVYAAQKGRSLSDLIENYLKSLVQNKGREKLSPRVKKLLGSVSLPPDLDTKKAYAEYLAKKYK